MMRRCRTLVLPVALSLSVLALGGTATAAAPEIVTVTESTPGDVFFADCGGEFEVTLRGSVTTKYMFFRDEDGELLRFTKHVSAPADVLTNTSTGHSITVRANFVQSHVPIEGTDYFAVTIRGFRYMVNEPGKGIVVQEVGRITYADAFEEVALTLAGQHDLADPSQIGIAFCVALGATPPPPDGA